MRRQAQKRRGGCIDKRPEIQTPEEKPGHIEHRDIVGLNARQARRARSDSKNLTAQDKTGTDTVICDTSIIQPQRSVYGSAQSITEKSILNPQGVTYDSEKLFGKIINSSGVTQITPEAIMFEGSPYNVEIKRNREGQEGLFVRTNEGKFIGYMSYTTDDNGNIIQLDIDSAEIHQPIMNYVIALKTGYEPTDRVLKDCMTHSNIDDGGVPPTYLNDF